MGGFDDKQRGSQIGGAPGGGARAPAPGKQSLVEQVVPVAPRRAYAGDVALLDDQSRLATTDVEIPALEGALLATRQDAVRRGLLSHAAFDAGLALSQAMTQLQPAVTANASVDHGLQERAALAAQQLFAALQHDTAGDRHFHVQPSSGETTAITSHNPYTDETRVTTTFVVWTRSHDAGSWLQQLPALIRHAAWPDAFRGYRRLLDGLDRWVADQLRTRGQGAADQARGDAQQHFAQLRTGLDQIADKHARRVPAVFHLDPKTVAREQAAGRPAIDRVPLDVYVWKDAATGQFHLYDLTAPSRPHEQVVDGPPSAAHWKTFFEDVARYPEGEVRFRVPGGGGDVAPTTGKTRWYEWVGYAGLAIAAVGLAALTAGASVPATVCFATGAVAGGLSAAGHLADTAYLGTATTATIVLDVAQLVASFASFGAMSVTIKAGRAAAALATSRWFVPLVTTAATADAVQLVALTEVTIVELDKIQRAAGSTEDKQRAMAVLVTQLIVTGGLTALSVRGAANARALAGQALEVVEQNGINILRIADAPAEPTAASSAAMGEPERWLARLEASLDPAEQAKLAKMKAGKTPDQTREMLGHDLEAAHERVRTEVRAEQERAAIAAQSKARVAELRRQIAERDLVNDPEIRALLAKHAKNPSERLHRFRDKLLAKILHVEAERMYPGAEVLDSVEIYEQLREAEVEAWITDHPNQLREGLVRRDGQPYMQRGEIDMMVIERQPSGRAKIIAREEIKTGLRDSNASARGQLNAQSELLREAATGHKVIRLELAGRDISAEIDVATDATASKSTRGPARKGFDTSLGASAADLEALCKDLLARGAEAP